MDDKKAENNIESLQQDDGAYPPERDASFPQHDPVVVTQKRHFTDLFKRRRNVAFSVLILLSLVGAATYAIVLRPNSNDGTPQAAETNTEQGAPITTLGAIVASIEGTVEVSADGELWKSAEGGQSLANLDYIRTLDESRAIVLFDDGSVVRLDSKTRLYLSSLQAQSLEVTLLEGQVYSRVVESENQSFTVVTANDRFKALGTAYKTSTDNGVDTLEVYQSSVEVISNELKVSEGNKYDTVKKEQSALDLEELDKDGFAQWNKAKDSESDLFKDKLGVLKDREKKAEPIQTKQPTAQEGKSIVLQAAKTDGGVKLSWALNGVTSSQGFKIVRSVSDSTPTYGEDDALYVSDASATESIWYSDNGKTHYYRVCVYFEGTCSTYSNAVQAASPLVQKEEVTSGQIVLSIEDRDLSWTLVGGNAPHGYKVVLSSSPSPLYPQDSIQYVSAGSLTTSLPEKPAGEYYVRICKYTNNTQAEGCVDYSNTVVYLVAAP